MVMAFLLDTNVLSELHKGLKADANVRYCEAASPISANGIF